MKLYLAFFFFFFFIFFRPERSQKNVLYFIKNQRLCNKRLQPIDTGLHIRAFRSRQRH